MKHNVRPKDQKITILSELLSDFILFLEMPRQKDRNHMYIYNIDVVCIISRVIEYT